MCSSVLGHEYMRAVEIMPAGSWLGPESPQRVIIMLDLSHSFFPQLYFKGFLSLFSCLSEFPPLFSPSSSITVQLFTMPPCDLAGWTFGTSDSDSMSVDAEAFLPRAHSPLLRSDAPVSCYSLLLPSWTVQRTLRAYYNAGR